MVKRLELINFQLENFLDEIKNLLNSLKNQNDNLRELKDFLREVTTVVKGLKETNLEFQTRTVVDNLKKEREFTESKEIERVLNAFDFFLKDLSLDLKKAELRATEGALEERREVFSINKILDILSNFLNEKVFSFFNGFFKNIKDIFIKFNDLTSGLINTFTNIPNAILDAFANIIGSLWGLWDGFVLIINQLMNLEWFRDGIKWINESVLKPFLAGFIEFFNNIVKPFYSWLINRYKAIFGAIKDAFINQVNLIKDIFVSFQSGEWLHGLANLFNLLFITPLKNMFTLASKIIGEPFERIVNGLKDFFTRTLISLIDVINKIPLVNIEYPEFLNVKTDFDNKYLDILESNFKVKTRTNFQDVILQSLPEDTQESLIAQSQLVSSIMSTNTISKSSELITNNQNQILQSTEKTANTLNQGINVVVENVIYNEDKEQKLNKALKNQLF